MSASVPATAAFTCGPAGAGKTTWATAREATGWARLSMDEEVWARGYVDHDAPHAVLLEIEAELRSRLLALIGEGRDVVVDLSFSTRAIRAEYRTLVRDAGARCELVWFEVPIAVLRERLALRDRTRGPNAVRLDDATLTRYVEGFEVPTPDEGFDTFTTVTV